MSGPLPYSFLEFGFSVADSFASAAERVRDRTDTEVQFCCGGGAGLDLNGGMTELSLNQLKLREDQQPDYPLLRQPAACQQWGSQQSLLMSPSGCATVLLFWQAT